jgi:D-inositol-3-phosphate glycosyltransferase
VVLEAFASGLPVVGVKKGGVADLVQNKLNGLLGRPNDPKDFARRIQFYLDHPGALQKSRKGALETATHHDWPTINGRLIERYEFFIRENKGKRLLTEKTHPHPFRLGGPYLIPPTQPVKKRSG